MEININIIKYIGPTLRTIIHFIVAGICIQHVGAVTLTPNSSVTNSSNNISNFRLNLQLGDLENNNQQLKHAADEGDVKAQVKLGLAFQSGDGGYLDYQEAAKWFKLATIKGNAEAQEYLGKMYYSGQGVLTNKILAIALLTLSAESGRASANLTLKEATKGMSAQKLSEASKLANYCKQVKFKDCF